eukprot:scaffold23402_cov125-Isochrysis_galbana.AAC.2
MPPRPRASSPDIPRPLSPMPPVCLPASPACRSPALVPEGLGRASCFTGVEPPPDSHTSGAVGALLASRHRPKGLRRHKAPHARRCDAAPSQHASSATGHSARAVRPEPLLGVRQAPVRAAHPSTFPQLDTCRKAATLPHTPSAHARDSLVLIEIPCTRCTLHARRRRRRRKQLLVKDRLSVLTLRPLALADHSSLQRPDTVAV